MFGVNASGQAENTVTFTYVIDPNADTQSPTITPNLPVGHSNTAVTVSFIVKDNKSAPTTSYYTVDGTEPSINSQTYISGDASNGLTGPGILIS
ncbi:chitobiase/beta-hexosaminidase C-terminal domain-containing protein [Paenibacillus hexagrammi]|uniref:Chitobiase/beta-hexosaminidase C-terminal domain-containing protein n=1 Tax=Paenibacillus hexagrammi TaxID=2908839 RepID=A0ABY3SBR0_9BACL|nr:chitobiase/beta-hexosaminidase C-terminal domain-containing protein [Paenibacillus sp. YPD9-1]